MLEFFPDPASTRPPPRPAAACGSTTSTGCTPPAWRPGCRRPTAVAAPAPAAGRGLRDADRLPRRPRRQPAAARAEPRTRPRRRPGCPEPRSRKTVPPRGDSAPASRPAEPSSSSRHGAAIRTTSSSTPPIASARRAGRDRAVVEGEVAPGQPGSTGDRAPPRRPRGRRAPARSRAGASCRGSGRRPDRRPPRPRRTRPTSSAADGRARGGWSARGRSRPDRTGTAVADRPGARA